MVYLLNHYPLKTKIFYYLLFLSSVLFLIFTVFYTLILILQVDYIGIIIMVFIDIILSFVTCNIYNSLNFYSLFNNNYFTEPHNILINKFRKFKKHRYNEVDHLELYKNSLFIKIKDKIISYNFKYISDKKELLIFLENKTKKTIQIQNK